MKKYTDVKDVMYHYFIKDKNLIKVEEKIINGKLVSKADYKENFSIITVDNKTRLYYIPENPNFKILDDMIDITNNPKFELENIINNSLFYSNAYIEGTDGTGKSTLTKGLAQKGIITEDRLVKNVSKIMERDIPENLRLASVEDFLKNNPDKKLIIMIVSDKNELKNRIFGRDRVSEYDLRAVDKQELYIQTFSKLKHYPNIFLVDILGLSPEEVQKIVSNICREQTKQQEFLNTSIEELLDNV